MSAVQRHARYEELVAGFALDALEPADEQEVLSHLPTCAACERDLTAHLETLSHLAHAADEGAPPAGAWAGVRAQIEAESPGAFAEPVSLGSASSGGAVVADLAHARARRRPSGRQVAAWSSVAAAFLIVVGLGTAGVTTLQRDRNAQDAMSARLSAAVRAVETAPARTVPLSGRDGKVTAVAVVQGNKLSLIVDGLARNDASSSTYVLWGQSRSEANRALATFDVRDGQLDVVRDLPLSATGGELPELFLITHEHGRAAPESTVQPALATGRAA